MSAIEWTWKTHNPILGCTRVGDDCRNCYAEPQSWRNGNMGMAEHAAVTRLVDGKPRWNGRAVKNSDARFYWLRALRPSAVRRLVFSNSMSDLFFDEAVRTGLTAEVFYEIRACAPGYVFQILTKRPAEAAAFFAAHPEFSNLPNVWIGASVGDARYLDRVEALRAVPAVLLFLSLEPLIGPITGLDLRGIGWVIAGGESGRGARRMDPDWAREIRDLCLAAGVPFFFKQLGTVLAREHILRGKGGAADAVLDGREWKEFPP